ncbi:hypothetical protein RHGRI_021078 [Rhododendron griersonianum]|uniref:Uncharacterized protein n=1 Tax=Rhododendron griersonianum TaxID=479676 RepID=A0AAV6JK72_9ERIC|nr:hypothetical protein RHGRI_021078 [Rhododendron griersonianum]
MYNRREDVTRRKGSWYMVLYPLRTTKKQHNQLKESLPKLPQRHVFLSIFLHHFSHRHFEIFLGYMNPPLP